MIKTIFYFLCIAGFLVACDFNSNEKASLRIEVDSLRTELANSQKMGIALLEVGALIDSIDFNRKVLRTSMLEGTSYAEYVVRMEDINSHIKKTEAKIIALEKSAKSSKSTANTYWASLKKFKAQLATRNEEMARLQVQVDQYRNENENLIQTIDLQKAEIDEKLVHIETKQSEVAQLETHVTELLARSKIDEAEAYYLRAQAVETAANRTKLAPRKKRETREEALELYRLAASYGKTEAEEKIAELEKKI